MLSLLLISVDAQTFNGGGFTIADGGSLRRVAVTLTDFSGNRQTVFTNAFGYYHFDELVVGQTYTLTVSSKTHQFENPSRVINLSDEISDADFTALPQ